MTQARFRTALGRVVTALETLKVPCHIGGSLASSRHGIARATIDADIVAALGERHVRPFVALLGDDYYADAEMGLDAVRHKSSFNVIYLDGMLKVDIFVAQDTPYARTEMSRAVRGYLGEDHDRLAAMFKSPEDIVLRKLEWYCMSDHVLERQLTDVRGVLQVRAGTIDVAYMRAWAPALGVADLLERALEEAGLTP